LTGSPELFAWAGFELWYSWSLPLVDHLPSNCESLSSNPTTAKTQNKRQQGGGGGRGKTRKHSWKPSLTRIVWNDFRKRKLKSWDQAHHSSVMDGAADNFPAPIQSQPSYKDWVLIFLCGSGVWTQGLILARQAFYHLSHSASILWCSTQSSLDLRLTVSSTGLGVKRW
jgi:hypothetical protein